MFSLISQYTAMPLTFLGKQSLRIKSFFHQAVYSVYHSFPVFFVCHAKPLISRMEHLYINSSLLKQFSDQCRKKILCLQISVFDIFQKRFKTCLKHIKKLWCQAPHIHGDR